MTDLEASVNRMYENRYVRRFTLAVFVNSEEMNTMDMRLAQYRRAFEWAMYKVPEYADWFQTAYQRGED